MALKNNGVTGDSADSGSVKGDTDGTGQDRKSGKGVAKGKKTKFAKSHPKYWEEKVFRPTYTEDGEKRTAKHFTARIGHKGKRHSFPLGTGNKTAAGKKAAEIYLFLLANDWPETLAKFSPSHAPKSEKPVTVGEFIREAQACASVAPDVLSDYSASFRGIVADIAKIGSTVTVEEGKRIFDEKTGKHRIVKVKREKDIRFDYRTSEGQKWREKVDAVKLAAITPAKVQKWKLAYVRERADDDHEQERRAKNSANSRIRQAKALFSKKILPHVARSLALPEELPFDGVDFFPRQSMRYASKIDAPALIRKAVETLAESEPEAFKIFLLGIMAGLRAKEIDTLLWSQIDFEGGTIRIEATPYFRPKSEDSIASVEIEPETVELLRGYRARAKGEFVIESDRKPRPRAKHRERRAKKEFATLYAWLKAEGVEARKPLHELRKEFGSLICRQGGIYAASRALRHADVAITAAHYLDKKERVTVGLGGYLKPSQEEPEGDKITPIEEGRKEAG